MTWNDVDEYRLNEIISTCSTTEVIASAIGNIIDAKITLAGKSGNMPYEIFNASKSLDFNERLLCAALDELRKEKQ